MQERKLKLTILPESLAICRLEKGTSLPDWALADNFVSVTRTVEELSIVCPQRNVPADVKREEGRRCLKVEGPLDLSLTGVLASLTRPLARAGISVFAISTFDTDYLLVKEEDLEKAIVILVGRGHQVQENISE